mmetsp:Transcript_3811/g.10262  ORF Transcript_3811/g.10262 Transcript_3811/m.10262 type:complete len:366 (-) Transcript_3811:967-2064(-)
MDSALIVKRTFIEVADEPLPAGSRKGRTLRAWSDSALIDTFERMYALNELDDLLANQSLQRAETEGAGQPFAGDTMVRRLSVTSTRCPSVEGPSGTASPARSSTARPSKGQSLAELPLGSPLTSPTCSFRSRWADEEVDDDLVSWTSEAGPFKAVASLFTAEAQCRSAPGAACSESQDGKPRCKTKRAARGGAAGRRQRAAREAAGNPEAGDAQTGSSPETAEQDGEAEEAGSTTVTLRDLPKDCTRDAVQAMLDNRGLAGAYDFLYVPIDFKTRANLGHAIVNFASSSAAMVFCQAFDGSVTFNASCNGLDALLTRYRNSPVMHPAVPDDFRPAIFRDGRRADFPAPSKEPRLLRSLVDGQRTA